MIPSDPSHTFEPCPALAWEAADLVLAGHAGRLGPVFLPWRPGAWAGLQEAVRRLADPGPLPMPTASQVQAWLGPGAEPVGEPGDPRTERERVEARERIPATGLVGEREALGWLFAELAFWGRQVRGWEEAWYGNQGYRLPGALPDPDRDRRLVALWSALARGGDEAWNQRRTCDRYLVPLVRRVVVSELRRAGFSESALGSLVRSFADDLFFRLLMAGDWKDISVRVVETSGRGPLEAVAALLPPGAWATVADGIVDHEGYGVTAALALPRTSNRGVRRIVLRSALQADRDVLRDLWDLHLSRALLRHLWGTETGPGDRDQADRVIRNHLGRASGRLRAVAMVSVDDLLSPVLALPDFGARLAHAVARYARTWAWDEIHDSFSRNIFRPVTRPCRREDQPVATASLPDEDRPFLATWVCLAAFRFGLAELFDWAELHSTDGRNNQLDALLHAIPDTMADAARTGRARSYDRLRAWLVENLPEVASEWVPTWRAIAALDPGSRKLGERVRVIVGDRWHPDLFYPRGGFPEIVHRVRAALLVVDGLDRGAGRMLP